VSRSVVLGLALVAGLSFLLFVWSAPAERDGSEHVERGASQPEPAPPSLLELSSLPAAAAIAETTDEGVSALVNGDGRRPLGSHISGTVVLPRGFPKDKEVRVWGTVRAADSTQPQSYRSASMARDGSFSLTVPDGVGDVILSLESPLLELPKKVIARPGQADIVLVPEARWLLEGVVVPPLSLSTTGVSWAQMGVSWSIDPDLDVPSQDKADARSSPTYEKPICPGEAGAFVLHDVPLGIELVLCAKNPFGPDWSRSIEPLVSGERRKVEIALEPGITISGRVIDEYGEPVEGVEIETDEELGLENSFSGHRTRAPKTDADGRFELARQSRRVTGVMTYGPDIARGARVTVDATRGDVRDLVITVVRGGCIEGVVLWSSRMPVNRFEVTADGPDGYGAETGEEGHFRLCGLFEGKYRVEVHATGFDIAGSASVLEVQTGSAPLQLILEETPIFDLHGEVVDGRDQPIERFKVHATRPSPVYRSERTDGDSGRFVLGRLEPGDWTIKVTADDHQPVRQRVIVGAQSSAPLRFVLLPAARIRGRVVDAANDPVADALVMDESTAYVEDSEPSHTDSQGQFEIEASSRLTRLVASKLGFSPSAITELELVSGDIAEGVVLRLRESCRIEGRVLDELGGPVSGAVVEYISVMHAVESDAMGGFELEGVPPGQFRLIASRPETPEARASAEGTLVAGVPYTVVMRFESQDPVRARGRVLHGGLPMAWKLGLHSLSFYSQCDSDAEGRFEVTLPRPGNWRGAVYLASEAPTYENVLDIDVRYFEVTVPDVESFAFELDFDALPRVTSLEQLWW